MESDGKFNKNFVVNRIKEYNIEYLNSYVNENCLDGDVSSFLVNEIDFIENKIKENKNYGFGMQLFQHQKKIIYDYCRLNKIDLHNGFTPPQKKSKPINTPKILNESLDILFDSLKAKYIKCNKTDYNKLFNGSKIDSFKIEWFGSIGLLKELFNQLHSKYKFENRNYYKAIFQFTKEQYRNNKVSTKDKKTATLLLQ